MRALRFTAPGAVALVELAAPTTGQGDALVAPSHVGLCATDLELFIGELPYFAQGVASYCGSAPDRSG